MAAEGAAMESFFILIAIAYLIAPIAAFVLVLGARNRIDELAIRLARIDRQLASIPKAAAGVPAAETRAAERVELETLTTPPVAPTAEPVSAPKPTSVPQSQSATPARAQGKSFEEKFGTRWVVWIGGLALALGGYFLVRYTIEQGLIGPGARIVLGALLAAGLIAFGMRCTISSAPARRSSCSGSSPLRHSPRPCCMDRPWQDLASSAPS
jgi:uncharacterized membrane protein